jgi:hypothetical protein
LEPVAGRVIGDWQLGAIESSWNEESNVFSVKVHLLRGPDFRQPSGGAPTKSVYLLVAFNREGNIESIALDRADGFSMDASTLRRFAWARWLTVADAALRDHQDPSGRETDALFAPSADVERFHRKRRQQSRGTEVKRPGRRGHGEQHYQEVAKRYRELRLEGSISPTQDIAAERCVSRNTAAGWVRTARQRGFLAQARRGRPG